MQEVGLESVLASAQTAWKGPKLLEDEAGSVPPAAMVPPAEKSLTAKGKQLSVISKYVEMIHFVLLLCHAIDCPLT